MYVVSCLTNKPVTFEGGQLRYFKPAWEAITSDMWILDTISGYRIELDTVPVQKVVPYEIKLCLREKVLIDKELESFLRKGIIEEVEHSDINEYYSTIFCRKKKDGSIRIILNLRNFNDCVEKLHFKMETLRSAVASIQPGDYFGSIDLKDAYFSVLIHEQDRKYLRFLWNSICYQFCVLPQGLSSSPRVFTKLLKPVYSYFEEKRSF